MKVKLFPNINKNERSDRIPAIEINANANEIAKIGFDHMFEIKTIMLLIGFKIAM